MLNILKSYLIRTRRTPARMVIILCPLIFTGLFIVYLLSATGLKGVELAYFFGVYTILASFSVSFFIPMLYESDKNRDLSKKIVFCKIYLYLYFINDY